jgi:molybdopterin molybdotransferase
LKAALEELGILPRLLHLADNKALIIKELEKALLEHDVLILSGGVSKGKFDFIPDALDALGVQKVFHRVAQRPGKPFWFGIQERHKKVVFSFPGNPVSTFANYHVYFLPWLTKSLGIAFEQRSVIMDEPVQPHPTLSLFLQVETKWREGQLHAKLVQGNGSGDLVSLALAHGFIQVPAGMKECIKDSILIFIPVA